MESKEFKYINKVLLSNDLESILNKMFFLMEYLPPEESDKRYGEFKLLKEQILDFFNL